MSRRHNTNDTNSFNNATHFNTLAWNTFTVPDERSEILAWLSPLESRIRHHEIQTNRVPGVGDWLLQTEVLQSWSGASPRDGSDNATLFYFGDPGVGKTYITSLVIDTLVDQFHEENIAVACFYFDFFSRKEQMPANVLGALLKQVVGGLEVIPEEIVKVYHDQKKLIDGWGPRLPELMKMFQVVSSRCTFICVDALDECAREYQQEILYSLQTILEGSPSIRLFLTGRTHIGSMVKGVFGERATIACMRPSGGDITEYLRVRLYEDPTPDAMDANLAKDILYIIPKSISEMFSLASPSIEAILREPTIYRRRQRLNVMVLELEGAYGATVKRIKAQGGEKARLGMAALMWISYSERPLRVDELCHALAVEIGSEDLNLENVPSIETLLECCQGLVAEEASTVRLIHPTLQEYLSTCPDLFDKAHSTIAETCLTCLNFRQFKDPPISDSSHPVRTPFLGYSSIYWGIHGKRELSRCAKSLALKLFDDYDDHISVKLLLEHVSDPGRHGDKKGGFSAFTGLHCASFFGIVEVVAALVEMGGYDVDQIDCVGNTPLIWAAENGCEGVVELLLERGDVSPNKPGRYGRTPLLRAAENGHERVVGLLLQRKDVSPDQPDTTLGHTPLLRAAANGYEGVVKLLLEREDVNPDKPDRYGRAPLSWAAGNGREGVVELLLGREDTDPNQLDYEDLTPLSWAVKNGQEGVAKFLLGREDVHADRPGFDGRTPLWGAAWNGYEGVVEVLLGREHVDPNRAATEGQTPLSGAARNGHEGTVRLLLARRDVNPNKPDDRGQTPLSWASENGHERVVKLLLEREDVNPDGPDDRGQTPFSWASGNGHETVVKLLLKRKDVNPDKPDRYGRTPLSWAAGNGREGVVELLLGREDADPNQPDYEDLTPLSWAAKNGQEGVVKFLLGRGDICADRPGFDGRTPLLWAAENGHEKVVRLLLQRKDVNPDQPDTVLGHTPLLRAAGNGYEGVVKLLLERDGVNPNRHGFDGRTPLWGAAWNGYEGVVKVLLGREHVDPDKPDTEGQTPLSGAARNGYEGVVRLLLTREDVDPNRADAEGQTSLSSAAKKGHEGVVNLLRKRKDVTPDEPEGSSHMPSPPHATSYKRARLVL